MKKITSLQNPLVCRVAHLKESKGRQQERSFVAEGIRACNTLLDGGYIPQFCFITASMIDHGLRIDQAEIFEVSNAVMKKISSATTPSGFLVVFSLPNTPAPASLTSGIVLAQVHDPGNMGTLIRTCAALGKHSVVIIEGADPFGPKVVQSSAGTLGLVRIFRWTWQDLLNYKNNLALYGLVVDGGITPQLVQDREGLLVIGSEAHGIPDEWLESCDALLSLPMPGGTESLNAAVAGAIAMYSMWQL